jgi:hypothetical protein
LVRRFPSRRDRSMKPFSSRPVAAPSRNRPGR